MNPSGRGVSPEWVKTGTVTGQLTDGTPFAGRAAMVNCWPRPDWR